MASKLDRNPNNADTCLQWQAKLIDLVVTLSIIDSKNVLEVLYPQESSLCSVSYEVTVLEAMALFYLSNSPYESGHTGTDVSQVTDIMYQHCKELNEMILDDTGFSVVP